MGLPNSATPPSLLLSHPEVHKTKVWLSSVTGKTRTSPI